MQDSEYLDAANGSLHMDSDRGNLPCLLHLSCCELSAPNSEEWRDVEGNALGFQKVLNEKPFVSHDIIPNIQERQQIAILEEMSVRHPPTPVL